MFACAATLFTLLASAWGDTAVIDSALQSDDQCDAADAECSFNALQLRGFKEEMELEEGNEEAEGWLKDITTKTKNHFKHILAPLQKPIVTNYQYLTVLDTYVNYTMRKIENATGRVVVWNRKSLLQEDEEETEESTEEELAEEENTWSRRRRVGKSEDLPPRARYSANIAWVRACSARVLLFGLLSRILVYLRKVRAAVQICFVPLHTDVVCCPQQQRIHQQDPDLPQQGDGCCVEPEHHCGP